MFYAFRNIWHQSVFLENTLGIYVFKSWRQEEKNYLKILIELWKLTCFSLGSEKVNLDIQHTNSTEVGGVLNRHLSELSFLHVTTITWAYSWVFGFFQNLFCQKKTPPRSNPFFFCLIKYWPKLFLKTFRIKIRTISVQICFKN